jgi:hypothetical protein
VSGRGPGIFLAAGRAAVGVRHSLTRPAKRSCTPSHRPAGSSGTRTAQRRHVRQLSCRTTPCRTFVLPAWGHYRRRGFMTGSKGPRTGVSGCVSGSWVTRKGVSGLGAALPAAHSGGPVPAEPPSGTPAAKPKNCDAGTTPWNLHNKLPLRLPCDVSKDALDIFLSYLYKDMQSLYGIDPGALLLKVRLSTAPFSFCCSSSDRSSFSLSSSKQFSYSKVDT